MWTPLRIKTLAILILITSPNQKRLGVEGQSMVVPGPSTGIIIVDNPGLLITERKLIAQTIYVDLNPETEIRKAIPIPDDMDKEFMEWYRIHIERTQASVRKTMSNIEKTFVKKEMHPNHREKRFIGLLIGMIVLTVIGAVVGTTMSIANSVTVEQVNKKTEELRQDLRAIQDRLEAQTTLNEDLIAIINRTVIIQNENSKLLSHSVNLHEKAGKTKKYFYEYIDPITYFTQEFLREVESSIASLIQGKIPLYFLKENTVIEILMKMHNMPLEQLQINVALEMGCAIPLYYDYKKMQIAFMVNLPIIVPDKVYQTKKVLNVGTWVDDNYVRAKTPDVLAYQPWTDNAYLVPNLETCETFKDSNYLCPGKPFIPNSESLLCGVHSNDMDINLCDVVISRPENQDFNTVAKLVNNQWLVSTRLKNITITYANHGTFKTIPLTHRISLITVPKDVVISVGGHTLFHVNSEPIHSEVQLINTFSHNQIEIDPDLEYLLKHRHNQTVQMTIRQKNVTMTKTVYDRDDISAFEQRAWETQKFHALIITTLLLAIWLMAISISVFWNTQSRRKREREEARVYTDMSTESRIHYRPPKPPRNCIIAENADHPQNNPTSPTTTM